MNREFEEMARNFGSGKKRVLVILENKIE